MKLKNYSQEDLEQMTYSEITEIILSEKGNKMKIVDIFKKICTTLKLSDAEFENKIGAFFELISTDSKFIILDKGYCDLRKKHAPNVVFETEEEDEEEVQEEESAIEEEKTEEDDEENIFYDNSSEEDDVEDNEDELSDFVVVEEDDEEASM